MIYLDHAAGTPLLPEAWDAMRPWALAAGNAASSHAFGRAARKALDDARQRIAACLDCEPDEIFFTSGATEANNLAVFGLAADRPGEVLVSAIEHPCVLEPIQQIGRPVQWLPVAEDGVVRLPSPPGVGVRGDSEPAEKVVPSPNPKKVVLARDVFPPHPNPLPPEYRGEREPVLAALMLVNHETGAIQPVREFREHLPPGSPLHCDAAAAVGKMPVSFRRLGVTTMTVSGHKFHGPQGVGLLIVKKRTRLQPLLFGGHQQQGKRPGTESVALAVGLAAALEWATRNLDAHVRHVRELRQTLIERTGGLVNGEGVPHIVNLSFPGVSADALLMALDLAGVACSTGSACSSGSLLPSPVLKAMGIVGDRLTSAMRFSLSPTTTLDEVVQASDCITKCVNKLRQMTDVAV